MFLLFTDSEANPAERSIAHLARSAFVSVFDEIGDVALIDTYDELISATDAGPEKDNLLTVPFGMSATSKCADLERILPIITTEESAHIQSIKNAVSIIFLEGKDAQKRTPHPNEKTNGWPMSTNDVMQIQEASDPTVHNSLDLNWPLWSAPRIQNLRGQQVYADKCTTMPTKHVVVDTHPDKTNFEGVIFAANRRATSTLNDEDSLVRTFIDTFRHDPDALLRISLICADTDNFDQVSLQTQLRNVLGKLGEFACRVTVILLDGNSDSSAHRFDNASFYIPSDELSDFYDAVGYFCCQAPPLISDRYLSLFGLPDDYPLNLSEDKSLATLLKDSFHIARTAPEGYQQLRRFTIDNARDLFSAGHAVERIRAMLSSPALLDALPSIDARRDREAIYTQLIGLFDYTQSGWIDFKTKSAAPGFDIKKTDTVVDVGSGSGSFSRFCSVLAGEVVFCDINPHSLEAASEHISEVAECPIRGVLTSGEQLSIDTDYADKVICTEVLEHVQDPTKVMSELFRIGKPGALYLISVPDYLSETLQKPIAPPVYFEPPNHIRIFERETFTKLVADSGLEILNHQYQGFYSVFHWLIKWCDDPSLEYAWARLWKQMLDNRMGPATKASLDQQIAKSQSILARKPLA
ncbi:MAG: class I SAM-dependent methyltransferase [Pseudomonadota bacterium]